jgi:cation transport regulator ChaC
MRKGPRSFLTRREQRRRGPRSPGSTHTLLEGGQLEGSRRIKEQRITEQRAFLQQSTAATMLTAEEEDKAVFMVFAESGNVVAMRALLMRAADPAAMTMR